LRAHYSDRMSKEVSLRPAVTEDREFLFELHKASMGPYVEELFGPWDDAVQWEFFDRWFHPTDWSPWIPWPFSTRDVRREDVNGRSLCVLAPVPSSQGGDRTV
jgi:hypothetical protein